MWNNFRRFFLFALLIFIAAEVSGANISSQGRIDIGRSHTIETRYREGEILVGREAGVRSSSVRPFPRIPGAEVVKSITIGARGARIGTQALGEKKELVIDRVRLPEGMTVETAVVLLEQTPGALFVEPNYLVRKAVTPNDPNFRFQWALYNTGQRITGDKDTVNGTPGADIAAPEGWDIVSRAEDVVVAVLDTGIDYEHPDLSSNIWINSGEIPGNSLDDDENGYVDDVRGWNFAYRNANPMDDDVDGHGTHVAGIIGASGNNGTGISGISWSVELMPLKFLDRNGYGDVAEMIEAIEYAIANGAQIINASFAYQAFRPSQAEKAAIEAAGAAGVLFVAAAGNSGSNNDFNPTYPASHTDDEGNPLANLIAVAASDQNDALPHWSNYGPTSVHLAAPGTNIYSSVRRSLGDYGYISGTSMAAPHVSGAAALLLQENPGATVSDLKTALLETVDLGPAFEKKTISGGRLNLHGALLFEPAEIPPESPSDLEVESATPNEILISWRDLSIDEESFRVERGEDGGGFVQIAILPADSTSYADPGITDGREFAYRVRAWAGGRGSGYSNEASVLVPLAAPEDLSFYPTSAEIRLEWRDLSESEEGFEIERRSMEEMDSKVIAVVDADTVSYLDGDVRIGESYTYRMRAFNTFAGYSSYSGSLVARAGQVEKGSSSGDSRCFIATAAYGTPMASDVRLLRRFRDEVLLPHAAGRVAVDLYYRLSPPIADFIARHESLRKAARTALAPLIRLAEWNLGEESS